MGLAIAITPGVLQTSRFRTNWQFKSHQELKSMYEKFMGWLTREEFGEYMVFHSLFGEKIARRLAQEQHFNVPIV
jgi:hypothetical protein